MVRLKDGGDEMILEIRDLFQFHNGSIKSQIKELDSIAQFTFQFHNGSIKRHDLRCEVAEV